MRRYVVDGGNCYRGKTYDYGLSESSYQQHGGRITRNYETKSFGNDIGCQYERPGHTAPRAKIKRTHPMSIPNKRYLVGNHGNVISEVPAFYNDTSRPNIQRPNPNPISVSYDTNYVDDGPRYVTERRIPKLLYKRERFSGWTQAVRPVETRYFTEELKPRNVACLDGRFSTSDAVPVAEARYLTEDPRVPKLVTDVKCRMMVDASVGGMPARKKVTKVYLPEMRNRGTGSTDLTPQIERKFEKRDILL